jgi:hypothetical protein
MNDQASGAEPSQERVRAAVREARDDAAPFALGSAVILIVLAVVSLHAHWDLLGQRLWWLWLLIAAPYVMLAATLHLGLEMAAGRRNFPIKKRNVIGGQELRVSGDRSAPSTIIAPPKRRQPRRDQAADLHVGRWKRRHVGGVG